MAQYVTCPTCRAYVPLPQQAPGEQARCPACQSPLGAPAGHSGAGTPAASPNKTVLAEPEAMIRYTCAKCKKALESPASFAGTKLNCPSCNQRLQIPLKAAPLAAEPVNKTVLALGEGESAPAGSSHPAPQPIEVEPIDEPTAAVAAPRAAREGCLECGTDITKRSRVQTCPDCGSLFCSAQCYREHRYHAHDKRKKKRRQDVECDYCGSNRRPYVRTTITEGGWVTFAILLIFFFPLCWLGLLMTDTRVFCSDCDRRLD